MLCMIFITQSLYSAGTAGNSASYESRYIVDQPTAGVVPKGHFSLYALAYTNGGLMMELNAAVFENFNMGLSFSGTNIIGSGQTIWQNYPGIHLRYRVINEEKLLPAITIGVNTQGRGEYDTLENRYHTLSPGIFLASSKAFKWALGIMAFHGGMSYSFEPEPQERIPNIYFGFEQSIGKAFALYLEYNANLDDDNTRFINQSTGLMNAAIRWSVANNLTLEIQLRDVLDTQVNYNEFTRFISLEYTAGY